MTLRLGEDGLQILLQPPSDGAQVRIADGDTVLYEGPVSESLCLQLKDWPLPKPIDQLLRLSLPSLDHYSAEAFKPLDSPYLLVGTLAVDPDSGVPEWTEPVPIPGQMLPLSGMAGVLHYAQSVFEGGKVFFRMRRGAVEARMFRPRRNASRMWTSALRMGVPMDGSRWQGQPMTPERFEAYYIDAVRNAVRSNVRGGLLEGGFQPLDPDDPNFNWEATPPALYIRPYLFASGPVLGVKPASHYVFAIYVTPVGKYRADLVLRVEREQPRAFPGGTGGVKAACNYAPTLQMMGELYAAKAAVSPETQWTDVYDDILFVDGQGLVEEMGGANFFVLEARSEGITLRTPPSVQERPSADTILPGVTRDTLLRLGEMAGFRVKVGPVPLADLTGRGTEVARSLAVFTTGTAAGIAPVVAVRDGDKATRFAVWDDVDDPRRNRRIEADASPPGSALAAGRLLRNVLFQIQLGDEEGIESLLGERAAPLFERIIAESWIEKLPL